MASGTRCLLRDSLYQAVGSADSTCTSNMTNSTSKSLVLGRILASVVANLTSEVEGRDAKTQGAAQGGFLSPPPHVQYPRRSSVISRDHGGSPDPHGQASPVVN